MCREAAYDTDPLRSGRACNLLLEHLHRVRERSDAVPAQFHIVVEASSDDVHVAIDQARDYAPTFEIDASHIRPYALKNV